MSALKSVSKSSRSGFTLLELIGVMVVVAILAAAGAPGLVGLIRAQRTVDDSRQLAQIGDALQLGMLREQRWPLAENSAATGTDGDTSYWWNLAARHGAGSPSDVRYPLGARSGAGHTRKLYLAKSQWSGLSFLNITADGRIDGDNPWLGDPKNPTELRLLLLSSVNPDLPLPDSVAPAVFNRLWNDWSVGRDGNPVFGDWADYGLGATAWTGRAAELNLVRVDLRGWLCTVVIENRRAILQESGTGFEQSSANYSGTPLDEEWQLGSVYAHTENQVGSEIVVRLSQSSRDGLDYAVVEAFDLAKRGRVVDESLPVSIQIKGSKPISLGSPPVVSSVAVTGEATLDLTDRAPISLINPAAPDVPLPLGGWGNDDLPIQNRYFLSTQEILLGEPWTFQEVGIFIIDDTFSSLRFDGLQWQY